MYDRAITGFAVSPDGNLVAVSTTEEAQVSGLTTGLFVARAGTGAIAISSPTFTDAVLGFSPDSALLYTRNGDTIAARNPGDLAVVRSITLPAGAVFRGVAPNGRIVTAEAAAGTTSWRDPVTGAVAHTLPVALDNAVWAAGGGFGAGTSAGRRRAVPHVGRAGHHPDLRAAGRGCASCRRDDGRVARRRSGWRSAARTASSTSRRPARRTTRSARRCRRSSACWLRSICRTAPHGWRRWPRWRCPNVGQPLQVFDVPSAAPLLSQVFGSRRHRAVTRRPIAGVHRGRCVHSVGGGDRRRQRRHPIDRHRRDRRAGGSVQPDSARLGVVTGTGVDAWRLSDQMLDASYPPGAKRLQRRAVTRLVGRGRHPVVDADVRRLANVRRRPDPRPAAGVQRAGRRRLHDATA